jgi:hypothetical protein
MLRVCERRNRKKYSLRIKGKPVYYFDIKCTCEKYYYFLSFLNFYMLIEKLHV